MPACLFILFYLPVYFSYLLNAHPPLIPACLPACLSAYVPAIPIATNNNTPEKTLAMEAPTSRVWMTTAVLVTKALVSGVLCLPSRRKHVGIPFHRNLSTLSRLNFESSPRPFLLPPNTCLVYSPFERCACRMALVGLGFLFAFLSIKYKYLVFQKYG